MMKKNGKKRIMKMNQESVIQMRCDELMARMEQIRKSMKSLPAGILKIDQNGPYAKWYVLKPSRRILVTLVVS